MSPTKTLKPAPTLRRVSSPEEIRRVIDNHELATLSLRLPTPCDLDCVYCYGTPKTYKEVKARGHHLTYDELVRLVQDAAALGLRSVSLVGDGEPLLYRDGQGDFFGLVEAINAVGAQVTVFSNALSLTREQAERLAKGNVCFIAKQNSLDPEKQSYLTGRAKAGGKLDAALEHLIAAGFARSEPSRLAIHTIICKPNYDELPEMWRAWRRRGIIPYVQVYVPPRAPELRARFMDEFYVEPGRVKDLFHRLKDIDEAEFGYTWDADSSYPIAALGCTVVLTGIGVGPQGDVQLCAYTEAPVANVRTTSLRDIMRGPAVTAIRSHRYSDDEHGFNYGCRALALNETGDRFAKDPFHWGSEKPG